MSRWINAEWLMNFFTDIPNNFTLTIGNLRATVDDAPSIDIVRCSECKLGGTEDCPMDEIDDEYYCNFGEREGE